MSVHVMCESRIRYHACTPRFPWSPSLIEACHPGVVCIEGQLLGGHVCQMFKLLDSLLLYVEVDWRCSNHFRDAFVSFHVSFGLFYGSS